MDDEEKITSSTSSAADIIIEEENVHLHISDVNDENDSPREDFDESRLENEVAVNVDSDQEVVNDEKVEILDKSVKDEAKPTEDRDRLERRRFRWQKEIDDFDKETLLSHLQRASRHELMEVLKETEQINSYISEENAIYEFIMDEDETVQNMLDSVEVDDMDQSTQESFKLSYPAKCYFGKKKLEHIEKKFELEKAGYTHEIQNLKFELDSIKMSLQNLKEAKEKFDKNIRIGGRHPVTKKIILQKVAKYFDDSMRIKMALTNRYKIQIQSDIMEQNKILSQIKAQEKRLASLDMTEFQQTQFEHKKSCRELAMYKDQLGRFKSKFSRLLQSVTELKKTLEIEESEMEEMKSAVSKLEHLKTVMVAEQERNDQKVLELKAAMRKIKLDPRRHNLPEVIDYAAAKRENVNLKKNLKKWRNKVERAEHEKFLYLNSLCKKNADF